MPKQVSRAGANHMTKVSTATAPKKENPVAAPEKTAMTVVKEDPKPVQPKELTLEERIHKVENLQLMVSKRQRLLQTRIELERFQISSNDFNCSMSLKDSDGNTFATSFTPGIKKVIDFLKSSFDESIKTVEVQIKF